MEKAHIEGLPAYFVMEMHANEILNMGSQLINKNTGSGRNL